MTEGGFWSPENKWYVYWLDKDRSVHGDNLVTPVNFMAIAYGICDDKSRIDSILSRIEALMQKEKLFMWPISFFPYQPDEGYTVNYPFPNYENGDIFLAWGEVGIRAYQDFDPSIPIKYITNVLNQYEKDGLAFQRYDRTKQEGVGDDILANNSLPVVGLYRDIYGIQPRHNRLYLDPHMTPQLNGTVINYRLRDQDYLIELAVKNYSASINYFTINSAENFSINNEENKIFYYSGKNRMPSMVLTRDKQSGLIIRFNSHDKNNREVLSWKASSKTESMITDYEIFMLKPGNSYTILRNNKILRTEVSDPEGRIHFSGKAEPGKEDLFEIRGNE
ncbi:MAG: hypothetical protein IPN67_04675 [Bacteroidales bacterium]|nr:hypothetical protein [Bacteroidales bacterium]